MMEQIEYIAEIKEVGKPNVLTSSLIGEKKTRAELIEFWGLQEPDVEWYRLFQVINNIKIEIK